MSQAVANTGSPPQPDLIRQLLALLRGGQAHATLEQAVKHFRRTN